MYIEVLVILIIFFLFAAWFVWLKIQTYIDKRRYNPENDEGRKGEEHRKKLLAEGKPDPIRRITDSIKDSSGQGEPERREDIPTTNVNPVREDSDGDGKPFKWRNPFRRRK